MCHCWLQTYTVEMIMYGLLSISQHAAGLPKQHYSNTVLYDIFDTTQCAYV